MMGAMQEQMDALTSKKRQSVGTGEQTMRITYDDLSEDVADKDSRHIMFGDIAERCRSMSNGT